MTFLGVSPRSELHNGKAVKITSASRGRAFRSKSSPGTRIIHTHPPGSGLSTSITHAALHPAFCALFVLRPPPAQGFADVLFSVPLPRKSLFDNSTYEMKFLIAGLGNPGPKYELTRHNIGFLTLDQLADEHKAEFKTERHAEHAEMKYKGKTLHLIKPTTYMNLSGKAVAYWLQELKIPKENALIIVDDIALPFGTLRMRTKGSSAGHNGLKNIEETLGGQDYSRLRFGIGSDFGKGQQADYVLSNFSRQELDALPPIMTKANEMVLSFCTIGAARTMSLYNS